MNSLVITGIGMASSLGPSKSACAAARAGLSRPAPAPYRIEVDDEDTRDQVTAYLCRGIAEECAQTRLPELIRRATGDLTAAVEVSAEGLRCLLNAPSLDDPGGVRAALPAGFAASLAIEQRGHAGALSLLGAAADLLAKGEAKRCLVGGVDSYIEPAALSRLDAERQLKTPINGDGFIPGEGAAWVLVEKREDAEARGATALAELGPVATRRAGYSLSADEFVPTGAAWAQAICEALETNPDGASAIGDIVHDYNGYSRRGREWALAYMRARRRFEALEHARRSTPAESFGDLGAANGSFAICMAVTALARGYARGRETLVAAASDDGHRAAVVLRAAR